MTKRAPKRVRHKPARDTRAEIARLRRQVRYLQLQRKILLAALKAATQADQAN